MQNINWELIKTKIQKCWEDNLPYLREFKMKNGNIIQVTKYTHTEFRLLVIDLNNKLLLNQKIKDPEKCYNVIYSMMN